MTIGYKKMLCKSSQELLELEKKGQGLFSQVFLIDRFTCFAIVTSKSRNSYKKVRYCKGNSHIFGVYYRKVLR